MLGISDIKKGKIVVLDDEPYLVSSAEFLRKQQRRPVMRSILKNLRTGKTKEHSFQQSDKVAEADIETIQSQYLYAKSGMYFFMNQIDYNQIELTAKEVGENAPFLIEGQEVEILEFEGKPVALTLPIKVDRKIIEAPPGVRGDTSTNVMKDVTIEGGAKIKAPLFVSEGDTIRIDTRTGTYVERVQ
jgi:elongation factor P